MISFNDVVKKYPGGITAIDSVSIEIKKGETFVLVGTSGSGKTTTMKLINRLVEPSSGNIKIDGKDVSKLDPIPLRRSIGYVIQHVGLFPHFTVGRNVGLVPELSGWGKEKIRKKVDEMLKLVGLHPDEFRDRYPRTLSGGQQQRVGVARALAAEPDILLMDEPFGALDTITRKNLQVELSFLWNELNKTVLFVTHDINEALHIGDRIGIMDAGRIKQVGTPEEVANNPKDEFIESFFSDYKYVKKLFKSEKSVK